MKTLALSALSALLLSAPVHAQGMSRLADGSYQLTELGYQRIRDEIHRLDQRAVALTAENVELRRALEQRPPELQAPALVVGGLALVVGIVLGVAAVSAVNR